MKLDKQKIRELYDSGLGCRKIAAQLGYNFASVFKSLRSIARNRNEHLRSNAVHGLDFSSKESSLSIAVEHLARYIFTSSGFDVAIPASHAPFDLLVSINGHWCKIQVKSSCSKKESGHYVFSLIRTRSNSTSHRRTYYSNSECDYFLCIDKQDTAWLIPYEELAARRSITPALRFPGCKIFPR